VHNVSPAEAESEALGGAARESRRPAVSSEFKKATESVGWGRVANARWEWVPDCGNCNTETVGCKGSV